MTPTAAWTELQNRLAEISTLSQIASNLSWDQQVMMPSGGGPDRGTQLALLSGMSHARWNEPALAEALDALSGTEANDLQRAAVRNTKREHKRATAMPKDLVQAMSTARSAAFPAWAAAKESHDYASFVPHLETLVALTREEVAVLQAPDQDPYDVLLEPYDPGSTSASLDPMFERLGTELSSFLKAIQGKPAPGERPKGPFAIAPQQALHESLVPALGYDMNRGRLDESEHPFTIGMGYGDTRITTHYYDDDLLPGLGGTIHETGHGLYEQGIPKELRGTGAGHAAGMGLHESQSRFWENFIGRSPQFSEWLAPQINTHMGTSLTGPGLYAASNAVKPSLIRIFADEVTYNLHIVIRYQLERQLFSGQIEVAHLDQAWADAYEQKLGVRPAHVGEGVLQDVHWPQAYFGYFPSYTLGNLYASSLIKALEKVRPQMWAEVEKGDFAGILAWLRENVHSKAHLMDAPDIVNAACGGQQDHVADFVDHIWARHGALYGVSR
jgi:carboxypeptidase Taq